MAAAVVSVLASKAAEKRQQTKQRQAETTAGASGDSSELPSLAGTETDYLTQQRQYLQGPKRSNGKSRS